MKNIHLLPTDKPEEFSYEEAETNLEKHLASVPEYKGERRSAFISKQETLEEAAEKEFPLLDTKWCRTGAAEEENLQLLGHRKTFIKGAKWQAKRMYSEEDLRKVIQLARLCTLDGDTGDFVDLSGLTEICTYGLEETHSEDSIIEQFKKK